MARPSVITPEVQAAIDRLSADGVTLPGLRAALAAEGFNVSVPTLQRYRARARGTGPADAAAPQLGDMSPAALAADVRRQYERTRAIVERLAGQAASGSPVLNRWLSAVGKLGELAERLNRMVPPTPPDPETDPGHVAAKVRLLERVEQELARGGS